jgi:uncharacterized membrane protein
MKKETTILLILALFLLADALCLEQTLNLWRTLTEFSRGTFLSFEIFFALLISLIVFLITRKLIFKTIKRRPRFEIFQPLRRLILSVLTLKFARR